MSMNTLCTIADWINEHSWHIAALLTGVLIGMAFWFKFHPDDFYHYEEDKKEESEER